MTMADGEIDEGDAGADAVDQRRHWPTAVEAHQHLRPGLVAELERQAGQREPQETGDDQMCMKMWQPVETTILLVPVGNDMVDVSLCQQGGLLPVFHEAAEHPEQGMQPEYGECAETAGRSWR